MSCSWKNFISPSRDPGKIERDLGKGDWLASHMNRIQFYMVFIRIARSRPSSPPYEHPLREAEPLNDGISVNYDKIL